MSPFSPAIQSPFRPSSSPSVQFQTTPRVCRPRFYSATKDTTPSQPPLTQSEDQENQSLEDQEDPGEQHPWYLEEEPRRHPTLKTHDFPPLPQLPPGSPPILSGLLEQLANELGLEDLKLLDLRSLNPPAALGPGLIMLFGTARSERHLHVSGRFLKSWLRTKGINVEADGVLTARALKINMRRQRKKAKLLGNAAVSHTGDNGLATRWVCMNLGTIGLTPQEESAIESNDGSLTGFGTQQDGGGTTIVVQMLTESKRKELDLETLWSRILARRGDPNIVEDDLEYHEAGTHNRETSIFTEGGTSKVFARPSQRRFFSTSYRHSSLLDDSTEVTDPPNHAPTTNAVDTYVDPVNHIDATLEEIGQLQTAFAGLAFTDAIDELEDSADGSPSEFLRTWNNAIKILPLEQSWKFRMWLVAHGRKLGARRFTLSHLKELHEELELNGILCSREDYLGMLQAVYLEPEESKVSLDKQSQVALRILHTMFERGETILQNDVIVPLVESLCRAHQQGDKQRELQVVLEKLVFQADLPYMGTGLLKRLLAAYAHQGNWDRFWEVWRMPPKYLKARREQEYVFLWKTIAATGSQRLCRQAIRECFYEMLNESPGVRFTADIEKEVRACARIADPAAERLARHPQISLPKQVRSSRAEFIRLFYFMDRKRVYDAKVEIPY